MLQKFKLPAETAPVRSKLKYRRASHDVIAYVEGYGFARSKADGYDFYAFGRSFFIHKLGGIWYVSDIPTGRMLFGDGKTRDAAVQKFAFIYSKPEYRFWEMDNYGGLVEQFEKPFPTAELSI